MYKTLPIVCPKCKKVNAYNTNRERFEEVKVPWLKCGFCFEKSDKKEWK